MAAATSCPHRSPLCGSKWQRTGMGLMEETAGWKACRKSRITFGLRNYCCGCLCRPLRKVVSEKKGREAVGHNFKQSASRPRHTTPWETFTSLCEVVYSTYNISVYCTVCQRSSFDHPHQRDAEEVTYSTAYGQQQFHKALLCSLGCPGYPTTS